MADRILSLKITGVAVVKSVILLLDFHSGFKYCKNTLKGYLAPLDSISETSQKKKQKNKHSNSVEPDQTPHFVTSGLGLHCLPMSLVLDARHKWINSLFIIVLHCSHLQTVQTDVL